MATIRKSDIKSDSEIIIDFMSNAAVQNIPGYSSFSKAVANMMDGAEKEQPLKSANAHEIAEGIHECTCPSCGWKNTIVDEFHDGETHYCRKCGRKVRHRDEHNKKLRKMDNKTNDAL